MKPDATEYRPMTRTTRALGWILRRLVCALLGHRWPRRGPARTWTSWERCRVCDGYRSRRSEPDPWRYGRGKLPDCGLPAVNPWSRGLL